MSIDEMTAEERYRAEPAVTATPERLFERQWALTLLQRAMDALSAERTAAGRAAEMQVLRPFLDASGAPDYAALRMLWA